MSEIEVAGSLIPGTTNTPLDARTRRTALADIPNIPNPAAGMRIYILETGREYIVKTLKAKTVGGIEVAERQIDTYEPVPDKAALDAKADVSAVETVAGAVETVAGAVASLQTAVAGKADAEDLEALAATVATKVEDFSFTVAVDAETNAVTASYTPAGGSATPLTVSEDKQTITIPLSVLGISGLYTFFLFDSAGRLMASTAELSYQITGGNLLLTWGTGWAAGTWTLHGQSGRGEQGLPGTGGGLLIESGSGYALDNGTTKRGTVGTKSVSLEYSTLEGHENTGATGNYAFSAGYGAKASGNYSAVLGGVSNNATGVGSAVIGGGGNTASGSDSVVCGRGAVAPHLGEFAIGSSSSSSGAGTSQRGSVQFIQATTATDQSILTLGVTSPRFTLDSGDHYSCRIHLLGAQADGSTGDYYAIVKIKNVSGTTSLSGSVRVLEAWEGDANLGTPTIAITADDANDCLQIAVTPANSTATHWTAVVEYVKLNY